MKHRFDRAWNTSSALFCVLSLYLCNFWQKFWKSNEKFALENERAKFSSFEEKLFSPVLFIVFWTNVGQKWKYFVFTLAAAETL